MKATLTTLLALAMLSGTAFAGIYTPTVVEGTTHIEAPGYFGVYSESESAEHASVTIREAASETKDTDYYIWGGYTEGDESNANYNTVTMTGGQVHDIIVGDSSWGYGEASYNTLVVTGGIADNVVYVGEAGGTSIGNVAIVTGGSLNSLAVGIAYGEGYTANNNKLHLVGEGAEAEIEDAQGNAAKYTGGSISLGDVAVAEYDWGATAENNSIDIYGTGIEATGLSGFEQLNFHMVDGLTTSDTPMVSVTGELDLSELTAPINLYGDAVTDWSAFEGKEITLASAADGIIRPDFMTTEEEKYSILDASGATVAIATLRVVGYEMCPQSIVMSNIQGVPEPTTGTLSLLALAGLCIRRRKH